MLLALGVEDTTVRKITGHRSAELWRYQHLLPDLPDRVMASLAGVLLPDSTDTPTDTQPDSESEENEKGPQVAALLGVNGGVDEARTRDLRRDRPAF